MEPVEWDTISTRSIQPGDEIEHVEWNTISSSASNETAGKQNSNLESSAGDRNSANDTGRSRQSTDEFMLRILQSIEGLSNRIEDVEEKIKTSQQQITSEMAVVSNLISPLVRKIYPLCYLDFDHGRVVIELDHENCPKTSKFFLKIMKRQRLPGKREDVVLKYDRRGGDGEHRLTCNHPFHFHTSGDNSKLGGMSKWGLVWGAVNGNNTAFWLARDPIDKYFGRVVKGEDVLMRDLGKLFVLKEYGVE